MSNRRDDPADPALVRSVLRATPAEQQLLLGWARGLGAIRQGDLPAHRKVAATIAMTRERKAVWPLLKVLARALKLVVWERRSWKLRLGLGAPIASFVAVGNEAARIVDLGGGIGLPLWMLAGIGGLLAGAIADLIARRTGRARSGA